MSVVRKTRLAVLGVTAMVVVSWCSFATVGAVQSSNAHVTGAHVASTRALDSVQRYATALFSKIAVPPGATRITTPKGPLNPEVGDLGLRHLTDVERYYVLPATLNVDEFAQTHFPRSRWLEAESGIDTGTYTYTSDSFSLQPLCSNRHAAFCDVVYSARPLNDSQQELRVDVAVTWLPVLVGHLPRTGVVTLTGYNHISLLNSSSGQVRVTLNATQARQLRVDIAQLRSAPGGFCEEDSTLYKISVTSRSKGKVFWTATADECPGNLVIGEPRSHFKLNARSCPLDRLVATFFPAHEARGTKAGLKACQPSE